MQRWIPELTLLAALCAAVSGMHVLAEDAADTPAEQTAKATVTLSGTLVLPREAPEGVDTAKLELDKLTGTLQRQLPPVELPYPEGYDRMTKEQQRDWLKAFIKSPAYFEYVPRLVRWRQEQQKIKPLPVTFNKDGGFKVEGLKPGQWLFEARIPHERDGSLSRATFTDTIKLTGETGHVKLGERELLLHRVIAPGDSAPDFVAQTYDGKSFRLSDHRGKVVLIDFWATWCAPCVAEIPNLKAVYKEFGGEHFEMIGLSVDRTIEAPKQFHAMSPSAYLHGYVGERSRSKAYELYGIQSIPSIWLVGPDGQIIARDLRGPAIRDAVSRAVKAEAKK